jgi:hypothetical protein
MKDWQITLQQYLKDNKHKLPKGELKLYKSLTTRKRVWGDSKGFRLWESGEDKLIKALSKEISKAIDKEIIEILLMNTNAS